MCGRYTLVETNKLVERFQTINTREDIRQNYNVAPTHVMPVVIADGRDNELELMKWGFEPGWARRPLINAQAESLGEKRTFKESFANRRCLIPANGFYEWKENGSEKIPYYFRLVGGELYAFAGLYDEFLSKDGKKIREYTIITTEPNDLVKPVHNRMPVILHKEHEDDWLNSENTDPDFLERFLKPYPDFKMEAYVVSNAVGNRSNNTPDLINSI